MTTTHKSVRLSELLRRQIMASVVEEYVKNSLKDTVHENGLVLAGAIALEKQRIADEQWDNLFLFHRPILDNIPEWMLTGCTQLMLFQEDDTSIVFKHSTTGVRPCKRNAGDAVIPKEQWEKIFANLNSMEDLAATLDQGVRELRNEVVPILDSVGSTKQLLEIWPSMENFLPPHIADPDSGINLPALNISRLQEKIMGDKK